MQEARKIFIEMLIWTALLAILATLSFYHVEQSISVVKYHLHWGIKNLLDNYSLYHQSFLKFLLHTSVFHTGDSEAEWRTAFYLLPLYAFCDLLGGLSLKTICFFTVTSSLIFLVLFYYWIREFWGKQTAFFAASLLGFSAVFQEIARSGSYDAYSFLVAMAWIMLCFRFKENEKLSYYFFLGLMTGFMCYGYALLRVLTLVALVRVLVPSARRRWKAVGLFFAGLLIFLTPGVILLLAQQQGPTASMHLQFIDRENIFDYSRGSPQAFFKIIQDNLVIFIHRILGSDQLIEPMVLERTHAHFYSPLLVAPLLIGIGCAFRHKMQWSNRLLFVLSLMIFFPPLMTSSLGYVEARRSLLYVIPSYCLIGMGMKQIVDWIGKIKNALLRQATLLLLIVVVVMVLVSEGSWARRHILSPKRDVGFLNFVDGIKATGDNGKMYYIDGRSIYEYTWESDVMRAALMEKGRSLFDVQSGGLFAPAPYVAKDFYVATGPVVSGKELEAWCARNKIRDQLIFESPVSNTPVITVDRYFKFYAVHRLP